MARDDRTGEREPAAPDIVRARRIEIVDDRGVTRVVAGRLGEGDGAVYGIEVTAGDSAVRACVTAEDRSAGLTVLGGNETLIECRVSADAAESPVALELGAGGCAVASVDVSADGSLHLSIAPQIDIPAGSPRRR